MFEDLNNIFGKKDLFFDEREEGRNEYIKLQRRGDLNYEVEFQRKRVESKGDRVLNVIENEEGFLIVSRCIDDNEVEDSSIIIHITVITLKGIRYPCPQLFAVYFKEKDLIDIGDIRIFGQNVNQGYGSILVNELFKISEKQNVKKVTGWISGRDWNRVNRLKHFYEKNGFVVTLDSENKCGKIVLEINNVS